MNITKFFKKYHIEMYNFHLNCAKAKKANQGILFKLALALRLSCYIIHIYQNAMYFGLEYVVPSSH